MNKEIEKILNDCANFIQPFDDGGNNATSLMERLDSILKPNEPDTNKVYYKCECGSEDFIRMYNVWNEKIKVEVVVQNGEELWGVEEHGKEKDHPLGFICAECRQDAQELNDGL